ncbi:MAG TPA: hypothetical protein VJN93_00330 [Candidatus Acidoferrum sp.]|nr:hypothetical protein [Candidatus Acidoferrum sp.]
MDIRMKPWHVILGLAFLTSAIPARSMAQSEDFTARAAVAEEGPATETDTLAGIQTDDVIGKMINHNRRREEALRQYSEVRTYALKNTEGKLAAEAVVQVNYSAPGKKTFDKTSEKGSAIVRHLVFDRLMEEESQTSSGRKHHDSAITPANYSFTPEGQETIGPYHCYVFDAVPKRKEKDLFEGKIWIDSQDFAIVKIAGHPAKKLSFWVSRVEFVRQYQKVQGFWLPLRDETSVRVKLYGTKVFTIDHQESGINSGGEGEVGESENSPAQPSLNQIQ